MAFLPIFRVARFSRTDLGMLVARALKIGKIADGGMPPTYETMHQVAETPVDAQRPKRMPCSGQTRHPQMHLGSDDFANPKSLQLRIQELLRTGAAHVLFGNEVRSRVDIRLDLLALGGGQRGLDA